jgi:predicted O-linked N-acetylglucosamine transferase (SPINDLY family)
MSLIESELDQALFLQKNGELKKAKKILEKILKSQPDHFDSIFLLSIINYQLALFLDALKYNNFALELRSNFFQGYNNRAIILKKLKNFNEALISIDKAISLNPNFAEFYNNKANILKELKNFNEALISIDKAISLNPNFAEFYNNKAIILQDQSLHIDAVLNFQKAINIDPNIPFIKGRLLFSKMYICDWDNLIPLYKQVLEDVKKGKESADPFGYQAICDDELSLKLCAEIYSKKYYPEMKTDLDFHRVPKKKINIGYLSGEFREFATSMLMTEVWENHDKNIFNFYAFDNGYDDKSDRRNRIVKSFNEFIEINNLSDFEVFSLIRKKKIDILISLNGFNNSSRQSVFAKRVAPIQINYLGFPGTLGSKYFDYIIADKVIIPESSKNNYSEKVLYLPNCYQPSDTKRSIPDLNFNREQFNLPKNSFVFACFNNHYKINPNIFNSWMKILKNVEGSVLWLIETSEVACNNLKKQATKNGVDSSRLVFAKRMKLDQHLLRHNLADLFIDTSPYNAHTTANDSLWSGLPVLTFLGKTFPGRVSASLLQALGMSELIALNQEDYEKKAIELGNNRKKVEQLKLKLKENKNTQPLFNINMYSRDLEKLFLKSYNNYISGLSVDHLVI